MAGGKFFRRRQPLYKLWARRARTDEQRLMKMPPTKTSDAAAVCPPAEELLPLEVSADEQSCPLLAS